MALSNDKTNETRYPTHQLHCIVKKSISETFLNMSFKTIVQSYQWHIDCQWILFHIPTYRLGDISSSSTVEISFVSAYSKTFVQWSSGLSHILSIVIYFNSSESIDFLKLFHVKEFIHLLFTVGCKYYLPRIMRSVIKIT